MHFGRPKITLFSSTLPTQEEIENLPAFPREKLTLCLLLGCFPFKNQSWAKRKGLPEQLQTTHGASTGAGGLPAA